MLKTTVIAFVSCITLSTSSIFAPAQEILEPEPEPQPAVAEGSAPGSSAESVEPIEPAAAPERDYRGQSLLNEAADATRPVTLTLQQCVALALENNLDLEISALNPEIAQAGILIEAAQFEPELQVRYDYEDSTRPRSAESVAATGIAQTESRTDSYNAGITGELPIGLTYEFSAQSTGEESTFNNFAPQYDASAGISFSQPLLDGFGTDVNLADLRIARRNKEVADAALVRDLMDLVENIYTQYYNLLFREADLVAQRESLDLAQRLVTDNEARLEIGSMSSIDVLQARNELISRRQEIVNAERALLDAGAELKRLIFRDLAPTLAVRIVPVTTAPPVLRTDPDESILLALNNRPILVEERLALEQQGMRLRVARNNLLPQVDLRGSYDFLGQGDTFSAGFRDVEDRENPVWTIGVVLTIPLGAREERGQARQAELELEQRYLELQNQEQDVVLEVDTAARAVRGNWIAYEIAQEATALARQTYQAELERLRAGTTTTFVVAQVQRDLAVARTRELRARADWYISLVNLSRAEGTILKPLAIELE